MMNRNLYVRRWVSNTDGSMSEWIQKAARVNTAEDSGEILEKLCNSFGRSPRAIQATIDLLHRIPPRYATPYVTSDHLHQVFYNWQQAFLRGKDAVLSEDVVRLKLRRWAKRYSPDFEVETPMDRKMKRSPPLKKGVVGTRRITDDSSDYDFYKVCETLVVVLFFLLNKIQQVIRGWADSTDPEACVEINRLVSRMKDQGIALSILLGVTEDRGSMLAITSVPAVGLILANGFDKILIRTAINAGRDILYRCDEPDSFRVARDVLDTFKRYKASTPEAVHLSFDLLDSLIRESFVEDWFGSNQHYHTGLFNNYRRASRHHHVFGAQIVARRIKEWSLTGKFAYSKMTIKLLLDVAAAQHEPKDAVVIMEEIIKILSKKSTQILRLHSPAYRTLLKAWVSSGRNEASDKVREIIESAQEELDVGAYNLALQFWRSDVQRVEETFLVMQQRGVALNSFSWLQVLHCYVNAHLLDKAERALFRLNDTIENFHDEQNLTNGLCLLLNAYLLEAKSSGKSNEMIMKSRHLHSEIVSRDNVHPKIQGKTKRCRYFQPLLLFR